MSFDKELLYFWRSTTRFNL